MTAAQEPGAAGNRWLGLGALVGLVLLVAGLTHLLAILLIPMLAPKDAYTVLEARVGTAKGLVVLAPSRPGDAPIPFRDPATVQGLCFFDVSKSPVRVRVPVAPERLLTLSFRTPEGRVFYSMTDRAALKGQIDIRLVTEAELKDIEEVDDLDQDLPSELRLKTPEPRGLLVVTVLIAHPSEVREATREISAITCAPEPLPPPS